ncbi:hypothetical protein IT575_10560 [bacterium]|nr:hypothetical protein [bacterium]
MPEQNPGQRKERVGEVMGDNTGGHEKAPEDPKSDQAPASRSEIKVKPGE